MDASFVAIRVASLAALEMARLPVEAADLSIASARFAQDAAAQAW